MQASSQPSQTASQISLFPLPDGQKFALAAARLQAQTFKAMMGYQIEMLSFLKHRYEADMKFVDDLATCDELSSTFDVVSGFVQTAASDYANEASKVASIGSNSRSEVASEPGKRARKETETAA